MEYKKFNKAFQRMDKNLPSLTIDTGHRNYFHYELNRIPTVRENAGLQSFPDNFKFLGQRLVNINRSVMFVHQNTLMN